MLDKTVERIQVEMNLNKEQAERVVDMVLTEVKAKLPGGFQRNFVAVMNDEREFSLMDNLPLMRDTNESAAENSEGDSASSGGWRDTAKWKAKIEQSLDNLRKNGNQS